MTAAPGLNGLVLAGGRSRRFGQDKAALSIDGQPLLDRTAALLAPHVRQLRVSVRPAQADDALRAAHTLIIDDIEDGGPAAGLLAAHREAPDAAWLVLACDLPLLDAATVAQLVAARRPECRATAFAAPGDQRPEPLCAIYEPAGLAALAGRATDGRSLSPRALLLDGDVEIVLPVRAETLSNMNRPEDFERLKARGLC